MDSYFVHLSWLSFGSRNMSGGNQQSATSLQESDIVNVPENCDADKRIDPECWPNTRIYIPSPDYDVNTSAASENIQLHTNPSPGYSHFGFSSHGTFSRNNVSDAFRENCTSAGYNNATYDLSNENHEESLKCNVNTDGGKNQSFSDGLPLVHVVSNCYPNDNCAFPESQGNGRYSLYQLQGQLGDENDLKELGLIPGQGITLESLSKCVIRDRRSVNGERRLFSFQPQSRLTSYVNRYSEADASDRLKNGEGTYELNSCKEMDPSSQCRWNTFRIRHKNPQLLHPIVQSANNFYPSSNLPPAFHRIPVPAQDNLYANHKNLYQLNSDSSFLRNKPAANSRASLPMLMKDRKSGNRSSQNVYFSLMSAYNKPTLSRDVNIQDKNPSVHLYFEKPNSYQATFLKNKSKVNMQTDNNSSNGHAADNESIYGNGIFEYDDVLNSQIESGGNVIPLLSSSLRSKERLDNPIRFDDDDTVSYYSITDGCSLYAHRGSPVPQGSNMCHGHQILNDQGENCEVVNTAYHIYHSLLPQEGRQVQSEDDNSVSYYSITDGCSLYGHRESPISQSFPDIKIPLPYSQGLTEQKRSTHSMVNLRHEAQMQQPIQANGNEDIYDSNPKFSARYALDASTHYVNDPRNNKKDEQRKCDQLKPGIIETSFNSSNIEGVSGQLGNNSGSINTPESIYDGSHRDSRAIQISMSIPTTDPRIILCPSGLQVAEADRYDRLNEIPSRDLASRCFPWKCDASQVILWLAIVLFFISVLAYIIHQDPTPVSPLLWVFLIPLVLTVFFGFARRCQMC